MTITTTQLIEEVRKIASISPEFIYGDGLTSCSYFGRTVGDTSGQRCIMGQALYNLEVDMEKLLSNESRGTSPTIVTAINHNDVDILAKDKEELAWLGRVQAGQDEGSSWEQSVAYADDTYRIMKTTGADLV